MSYRTQGKMIRTTRENKKPGGEDQKLAVQGKKNVKGEDVARPRRAAFGDITNASQKNAANGKKDAGKKTAIPRMAETKTKPAGARTKTMAATLAQTKKTTTTQPPAGGGRAKDRKHVAVETEVTSSQDSSSQDSAVSSSQESVASGDSNNSMCDIIMADLDISHDELNHSRMSLDKSIHESCDSNQDEMPEVPLDAEDIDHDDVGDITLVALYAHDIFKYYKEREEQFKVRQYLDKQPQFTQRMRSVLVDWLVEVQENFELNHETLYLAVKLTDTYMSVTPDVPRDNIQLLGSVALFLASKFDERLPPAIDDFLYVCDNAYHRDQFMAMERELFRSVGFDLGRPIAYRFLRRYARCARSHIKTLYLARYLLELSLMEYKLVFHSESKTAASCLYIARRMRGEGGWNPTLEFYTGYKMEELQSLILDLNPLFTSKKHADLSTIRDKYKHYLFHSVGDIPPITQEELFPAEEADQH